MINITIGGLSKDKKITSNTAHSTFCNSPKYSILKLWQNQDLNQLRIAIVKSI